MSFELSSGLPVVREAARPVVEGRLVEAVGLVLEAQGLKASIGELFGVCSTSGEEIATEAVGLRADRTLLMPLGRTDGLEVGARVRRMGHAASVGVGPSLLGRVLDGLGRPLDGRPAPARLEKRPLHGVRTNPLRRRPIEEPFHVGIRAIDGLLTLGKGQRIGIFAGGGVGKSSLLGMMVRRARIDVAVVALIGERGREVEEFVHRTLGPEGLERSVVIAATSAEPPLVRARGALYATAVAEHFREQGHEVLLVMDSITRYAMALREIGLAVGEPPTTKGYPPTVFAALPRLLERAGTSAGPGAITGVYTVLVEGDDLSDPISDAARAILDGHVVLSRALAERGHFPAIEVPKSVSRVMPSVIGGEHAILAQRARELLAMYREVEDLVMVGAYERGTIPAFDEALDRMPRLAAFLRQHLDERADPESVLSVLGDVWEDDAKS